MKLFCYLQRQQHSDCCWGDGQRQDDPADSVPARGRLHQLRHGGLHAASTCGGHECGKESERGDRHQPGRGGETPACGAPATMSGRLYVIINGTQLRKSIGKIIFVTENVLPLSKQLMQGCKVLFLCIQFFRSRQLNGITFSVAI